MPHHKTLLATIAAVAVGCVGLSTAARATVFNLAGSLGASPTFSVTSGGLTATYTSPSGNGFVVQNTSGLLDFSPALIDTNFFGTDNLTITFSSPVAGQILIPFAIEDAFGSGDTLSVTTNAGQSFTFGTSPSSLALAEPEGVAKFAPTGSITSLTLSSQLAFAIGNVNVPEPMSIALLGAGLAGIAVARRRGMAGSLRK